MDDRGLSARILFLSHSTVAGGAELALVRILNAGPRWNAVVLLPRSPAGRGAFRAVTSVPVMSTGVGQRFGASTAGVVPQIVNAARLVIQAAATRVHPAFRSADIAVANSTRASAYGALAAITSRTPFVVHVRDLAEAEALGAAGAAIMRRLVLPRADGVIADTQRALSAAQPYIRSGTSRAVIPSASALVRREARARRSGPTVVGMLARIDPWKGQELLLDAFARAFPDGDERLEFAGGAPFGHDGFAAHLRHRAEELGVGPRVTLLGHVDDVDAVLHRWDIAVQASLRPEPLGQNVLQYLAAGCATVVADEGGPVEWVQNGVNGRRFAPRDAEALASELRELAADPALRHALGVAAIHTPGLRTDAEIAAEHRRFYADVLSQTRSRR